MSYVVLYHQTFTFVSLSTWNALSHLAILYMPFENHLKRTFEFIRVGMQSGCYLPLQIYNLSSGYKCKEYQVWIKGQIWGSGLNNYIISVTLVNFLQSSFSKPGSPHLKTDHFNTYSGRSNDRIQERNLWTLSLYINYKTNYFIINTFSHLKFKIFSNDRDNNMKFYFFLNLKV